MSDLCPDIKALIEEGVRNFINKVKEVKKMATKKLALSINQVGNGLSVADATKIAGNPEEYWFIELCEAFNVLSKVQEEFEKRANIVLSRVQTIGVTELAKAGVDGITTEYLDSVLTVKSEEVDEFVIDDAKIKASPTAKSFIKVVYTLERAKLKKAWKEGKLDPSDASAVSVNTIKQVKVRRVSKVSGAVVATVSAGNGDE